MSTPDSGPRATVPSDLSLWNDVPSKLSNNSGVDDLCRELGGDTDERGMVRDVVQVQTPAERM